MTQVEIDELYQILRRLENSIRNRIEFSKTDENRLIELQIIWDKERRV